MNMKAIETDDQLDALLAASGDRPVLLFKHSNACPISARAHDEVERFLDEAAPNFDFGAIVVQQSRALSDAVEQRLGLRHETPQAILVRDGKAVWNASHFKVTRQALADALADVPAEA